MEWEKISKEKCQELIESMPRRIAAVLKAKGGYTRYQFSCIFSFKISGYKTLSMSCCCYIIYVTSEFGRANLKSWETDYHMLDYLHE